MSSKVVESAAKPPNAGKGRKPGTPNKLTQTVKQAIEQAFNDVGGAAYLAEMARKQPKAFMSLLGKVIPQQVNANINAALLPAKIDDLA